MTLAVCVFFSYVGTFEPNRGPTRIPAAIKLYTHTVLGILKNMLPLRQEKKQNISSMPAIFLNIQPTKIYIF